MSTPRPTSTTYPEAYPAVVLVVSAAPATRGAEEAAAQEILRDLRERGTLAVQLPARGPLAPLLSSAVAARADADVVLVAGEEGLLTPLLDGGRTLADLGAALRYKGISCGVLAVVDDSPASPGVLALTQEALAARELPLLAAVPVPHPKENS